MKLSLNWILEFVDLPHCPEPKDLVESITLSTCEVEAYEAKGNHLKDIVAAEVIAIEPHPNAEKLQLVTINPGQGQERVVCGAWNFAVGDKVAFAGLGVELPGGFKLKKVKIRGVESLGMLCAEDELGFSDEHDGLMILEPEAKPGTPLSEIYPDQVDLVMEIDNKSITHRPDLWGHYGFARELAAIYRVKLKPYPVIALPLKQDPCPVRISLQAPALIPRYSALAITGVKIAHSPAWVRHRLYRLGLRAINNAVDATNFVMLELGEPMHAFDLQAIQGGELLIRQAQAGERLSTLVGKEAVFTPEDLLICDAQGPAVIAGIVGGEGSGVKDSTRQLLLEAANWNPVAVRKTSTRIGLRTDSSQRFEKSLDSSLTLPALGRALELLRLTCPNLSFYGGLFDHQAAAKESLPLQISEELISRRLGKKIESAETIDILTRLGFGVKPLENRLEVVVPSFRATKDIAIAEDLIEEVGRIHGFNHIEPQAPSFPIEKPRLNPKVRLERRIQQCLVDLGFYEVYCYPMTTDKKEAPYGLDQKGVMRLINPVSDLHSQMRTSLIPHFVERVRQAQKEDLHFRLFELGRSYKKIEGQIVERNHLILGLSVDKGELGQAFYQLKADLLSLLGQIQVGGLEVRQKAADQLALYQHPHIQAELLQGQKTFAEIFHLHPQTCQSQELKGEVALAEIDLDLLFQMDQAEYRYQEPYRYPGVHFELSVVTPERVTFAQVRDLLFQASKKVVQVTFLDQFTLEKERKSLSVSLLFRDHQKTLEPDEIKALQDKMIATLAQEGFPLR